MIGGGILAGALAVLALVCCTGLARAIGWPATTAAGSSRQPRGDGGYARRMEVYTGFDTHGKESGLLRWLTTVDHKDIGLLYIFFGAAAGLWGGTDGKIGRAHV